MTDDGVGTGRSAPATLHDVAREANVSLATASRSLNGSTRRVNEEYRKRVLEAAARLDYSPNLSAQAVARGTTTTVALLVADIADPYFSSIAAGVVAEADTDRLIVTMAATERDPERELELVRTLRGQRPRVMILAGSRPATDPTEGALAEELRAYERSGGRVVLISRNELGLRTLLVDDRGGAEALARELVAIGYRRFAVITGAEGLRTAADRVDGFRDGLAATGGTLDDDVIRDAFTRDGGYSGMRALLERGLHGVELVFAANDVMAVGALSAIREAGLVPGTDVAVAGFDDIPTVRDVTPALTTVHVPLEELGRRALRLALGDGEAADEGAVQTEVVLRESTPRITR
ncbi:LacI family DNA-binding transcriptional regulator [Agromyces bauzanensis]|uniref:LacI family transcriptional regulator n=1 Tax=Agromyces bauzanensis TaxID=1308924 RepID=A0A917USK9_9MICO|nr:LacI family DNA-binding transcriptional regulator [Agromyces bauzanensis]GGJ82403.1 LacI family transcriptional regulator [Agromyces bauzanensis]